MYRLVCIVRKPSKDATVVVLKQSAQQVIYMKSINFSVLHLESHMNYSALHLSSRRVIRRGTYPFAPVYLPGDAPCSLFDNRGTVREQGEVCHSQSIIGGARRESQGG